MEKESRDGLMSAMKPEILGALKAGGPAMRKNQGPAFPNVWIFYEGSVGDQGQSAASKVCRGLEVSPGNLSGEIFLL